MPKRPEHEHEKKHTLRQKNIEKLRAKRQESHHTQAQNENIRHKYPTDTKLERYQELAELEKQKHVSKKKKP